MKLKLVLTAISASAIISTANAVVIANLETDYTQTTPSTGWSYLWNANGQTIGSGTYTVLGASADDYRDNSSTDAVGEGGGTGNFVGIFGGDNTNGTIQAIISGRSSNNSDDSADHYFIARYTLQAGEGGVGTLSGEWNNVDGGTISVYVNNTLIDSETHPTDILSFTDLALGTLDTGDTVDIAFLSPDSDTGTRNSRRWFPTVNNAGIISTNPVPEPSSSALFGLGGLALLIRRRY